MRPVKFVLLLCAAAALASACATIPAPMNDTRFGTVDVGMTSEQVRLAFGAPEKTMKFPLSSHEAWDYFGTDTWGYMVDYSVTFGPDQRVVSKDARRINDGGDRGDK